MSSGSDMDIVAFKQYAALVGRVEKRQAKMIDQLQQTLNAKDEELNRLRERRDFELRDLNNKIHLVRNYHDAELRELHEMKDRELIAKNDELVALRADMAAMATELALEKQAHCVTAAELDLLKQDAKKKKDSKYDLDSKDILKNLVNSIQVFVTYFFAARLPIVTIVFAACNGFIQSVLGALWHRGAQRFTRWAAFEAWILAQTAAHPSLFYALWVVVIAIAICGSLLDVKKGVESAKKDNPAVAAKSSLNANVSAATGDTCAMDAVAAKSSLNANVSAANVSLREKYKTDRPELFDAFVSMTIFCVVFICT